MQTQNMHAPSIKSASFIYMKTILITEHNAEQLIKTRPIIFISDIVQPYVCVHDHNKVVKENQMKTIEHLFFLSL